MKYMFLMYSQETPDGPSAEDRERLQASHWALMEEARSKNILLAVEGLASTASAKTVRMQQGRPMVTDGPFAETKEQLAGYYILQCKDLNEAVEWASRMPTGCKGREGCIEIRPVAELPQRP